MTDQELKRLFDSFPVSPEIIRFACVKCGITRVSALEAGKTLEQARDRFAASHKSHCIAEVKP